jgi:hypothetical protein
MAAIRYRQISVQSGFITVLLTAVSAIAVYGCGSTKPIPRVAVSGQVARSCVGPIFAGRPRRCSDRAVFARGRTHVAVNGTFTVQLTPGTYRVSVDTCIDQQMLTVTRPITGLELAPRCPLPL